MKGWLACIKVSNGLYKKKGITIEITREYDLSLKKDKYALTAATYLL